MQPMAEALLRLGIRHGMVVHGRDGLDEVTTTRETAAIEVQDGTLTEQRLHAEAFGIPHAHLADLQGGTAEDNARIAGDLLRGKRSASRDIVVLNAGCAIYVADQAQTIPEGIAKASEALASGRALQLLEQVTRLCAHAG